jgi:IclR family transcriptional regulator, acetate operon repressor
MGGRLLPDACRPWRPAVGAAKHFRYPEVNAFLRNALPVRTLSAYSAEPMEGSGQASGRAAAPGTLGTVRNASVLLDLLSQGPALQQLTDLAERSGLSLPTVHRLLRSLVAAGLVEQDPRSSRYGLGPELVRLSARFLERHPLLPLVAPYLGSLRTRTSASTAVALLVRGEVVYVDRVEAAEADAFPRKASRTRAAVETAAGRLLLGRAEPAEQAAALQGLAAEPPTEETVKGWGRAAYLLADEPGPGGGAELAVPVVGLDGRAAAALVASGAPPALPRERLVSDVLPLLEHTAELAGRMLGGA